jgi:hypothetical protein
MTTTIKKINIGLLRDQVATEQWESFPEDWKPSSTKTAAFHSFSL